MTISIQLVEVPENEKVPSRQVILPANGGTIGRAYDCTLVLPDFDRKLSRKHLRIDLSPQGSFQVTDLSVNGSTLNQQPLNRGIPQQISDGDILKLGDYTLLLSDMVPFLTDTVEEEVVVTEERREPVFSVDNLQIDEFSTPLDDLHSNEIQAPEEAGFSADNVMADDQFGHDPFDDTVELKTPEPKLTADPFRTAEVVTLEGEDLEPVGDTAQLSRSIQQLQRSLQQQQQMQMGMYGQDKLLECLGATLDRFLEEFEPGQLEGMFDEYTSGWGNRDKKYWRLYKKQFSRRRDRNEFHQQFTALFMEELRRKK
ncbi:FHA domain-containing protein [Aliamphritea spongicola]|uniref:FHA domain-containing protein n=1 Tax=Aliamphritea spongicola TaxID=707589 RepID=UPI00196A7787|nr:FHA domain-containing protein [Aliamphritea spongicola]MBN3562162.1 FHA domain-containing protein [Aliamphritea spongicola]